MQSRTSLILALSIILSACSPAKFAMIQSQETSSTSGGLSTGLGSPALPPTTETLKTIQPVLATRALACISCHMNVKSNVVTDFGLGDPFYLHPGYGTASSASYLSSSAYFNTMGCSLQTASFNDNLMIVPKTLVTRSANPEVITSLLNVPAGQESMSLLEVLLQPMKTSNGCDNTGVNVGAAQPMISGSMASKITEKKSIYIGAPSEQEILGLTTALKANASASGFEVIKEDPRYAFSGLIEKGTGQNAHIENDPSSELICYGDVVVKGVLFLKNPKIRTNAEGCRIYVTGSVFMQGKVEYTSADTQSNLQISSARAIMLGFSQKTLHERLLLPASDGFPASGHNFKLRYYFTRASGYNPSKSTSENEAKNLAVNQAIMNDGLKLQGLEDAADPRTATYEASLPDDAFKHILLNAPQVHSRYAKEFTGVLVGEIVLFRLEKFNMTFDPVFVSTPALPALKNPVLSISAD